jgi:hypothetical protein
MRSHSENDSNGPLSGGNLAFSLGFDTSKNLNLAFSLGFDTLKNWKQARASLQEAVQRQRMRNTLLTRLVLRLDSKKLSPKFVGPFRILELCGKNAVKIQPTGRFRALHDIVNVEYLCPYNERER